MPLHNFSGESFVAYMDISGFKYMMERKEAVQALNNFYEIGYDVLRDQHEYDFGGKIDVEGLFVSDCCILITPRSSSFMYKLDKLLGVIRKINIKMLKYNYMLTTSIAYGEFQYDNRKEFKGIGKYPIYGHAYVDAFLDNEHNKEYPIKPGQCRIVINENERVGNILHNRDRIHYQNLYFVDQNSGDDNHLYYYWNIADEWHFSDKDLNENRIKKFKEAYNKAFDYPHNDPEMYEYMKCTLRESFKN